MTATRIATQAPPSPTSSQILSRAGQSLALQLRGTDDHSRWQVGDLSLSEIAKQEGKTVLVDGEKHVITKDEVRRAIGDLVGMESSTVRAREEVAEYWPRDERAEFDNPALTYSYFRAAMYAETKQAARAHLRYALESADEYGGMIMPVRVLRIRVKAQRRGLPGERQAAGKNDAPPLRETLRVIDAAIVDAENHPQAEPVKDVLEAARYEIGVALARLGG